MNKLKLFCHFVANSFMNQNPSISGARCMEKAKLWLGLRLCLKFAAFSSSEVCLEKTSQFALEHVFACIYLFTGKLSSLEANAVSGQSCIKYLFLLVTI